MSETMAHTNNSTPSAVTIDTLLKNMETRLLRLQAQMHGAAAAASYQPQETSKQS